MSNPQRWPHYNYHGIRNRYKKVTITSDDITNNSQTNSSVTGNNAEIIIIDPYGNFYIVGESQLVKEHID